MAKAKKVAKRIYRKRRPRKSVSIAKLVRKVNSIARTYKPELKEVVYSNGNTLVTLGQVFGNINAYYASDVTPVVSTGSSSLTRVGSSFRLKNIRLMYQLSAQSNMGQCPTIIKWYLVSVKGQPVTAASFTSLMFETNPFIFTSGGVNAGIIDANCQINHDYKSNYTIVKRWTDYFPMEFFSSGVPCKNKVVNVSWKTPKLIQFDNNTNNILTGQLILIGLCSSGNTNTTTGSTNTGIPITQANTGFVFHTNMRFHYYDD